MDPTFKTPKLPHCRTPATNYSSTHSPLLWEDSFSSETPPQVDMLFDHLTQRVHSLNCRWHKRARLLFHEKPGPLELTKSLYQVQSKLDELQQQSTRLKTRKDKLLRKYLGLQKQVTVVADLRTQVKQTQATISGSKNNLEAYTTLIQEAETSRAPLLQYM